MSQLEGTSPMPKNPSWIGRVLIACIRQYQRWISPLFGDICRFHPSCSNYMILAVQKYGLIRGVCKGIGRLARCHPFHPGGVDDP